VKGLFHFRIEECDKLNGKDIDDQKLVVENEPHHNQLMTPSYLIPKFNVCSPISHFDSYEIFNHHHNHQGISIRSGWKLFEDRVGKPGWISEEKGSVIEFEVSFQSSAFPKLVIGYLTSYENMGSAKLEFVSKMKVSKNKSNGGVDMMLKGIHRETKASQTYPTIIFVPPNLIENSRAKVRIISQSEDKFKIMYVITC